MRIISQDGLIDVSYENGNLSMSCGKYKDVECARIYYYSSASQKGTLLAEYNSESKAIKAMEMLYEAYVSYSTIRNGAGSVYSAFILPKVFRFPKDEDVEVE